MEIMGLTATPLFTIEQYHEWMKLPDWTIINDPHKHDLENEDNDHYFTENLYAKTPHGIIVVEAERVVNGASIPWICQPLIPKSGKWNRPSAFHDVGYEDGGFWVINQLGELKFVELSKSEIDYAYLKLMEKRGVQSWNRRTQYSGLIIGGWYAWYKYRRLDKQK